MTFDLHVDKKNKAKEYDMWVRRIYNVSYGLKIPYETIWNMTEHEFKLFEDILQEEIKRNQNKPGK